MTFGYRTVRQCICPDCAKIHKRPLFDEDVASLPEKDTREGKATEIICAECIGAGRGFNPPLKQYEYSFVGEKKRGQ